MPDLKYNKIILHHSKTKDGPTVSWDQIRKYHIEANGWKDIGYHFGLENVDGKIRVMIGRPLTEWGAHCSMHNAASAGICIVGDYDSEKLSIEKEMKVVDLCVSLCYMLEISPKEIYGDRDFHPTKTCPGNIFPLKRIKENVINVFESYRGIKELLFQELQVCR